VTRTRTTIASILGAPATHFLVLGMLLFVLAPVAPARSTAKAKREPIVIGSARVSELRDEYTRTFHKLPSAAELDALVEQAADEEMLYREALLLGLDRGDRAIGWRILDKMHFLFGEAAGSTAEAYERGVALGLKHDDTVVRSALITKMRLLGKAASRSDEPTGDALERALEDYRQRHRDEFTQAEQLSLTQVFLSTDQHGAALRADADAIRAKLEATGAPSLEAVRHLSDAFPAGLRLQHTTRAGLVKLFGEELADAMARLEPGRWSEPLHSPFGLHLVFVEERKARETMPLDEVRSSALRGYRAERHQAYLERMTAQLRNAYEVRVESDASAAR